MAKLIIEKKAAPKPKPIKKPEPVEKKKPEPKPKPKPVKPISKVKKPVAQIDTRQQAREKAKKTGLLALSDSLADLRDQAPLNQLKGSQRLTNSGSQARMIERSLITSSVGNATTGINTATLTRDIGSTELAGRTTTEIVAPAELELTGKGQHRTAGRSDEEIQIVFDRNKSSIYSLYNRELRKNPSLQGQFVIQLTIAPTGEVAAIKLVSSELDLPSLEKKLLRRIKLFKFGEKSVEAMTITYPIQFFPA